MQQPHPQRGLGAGAGGSLEKLSCAILPKAPEQGATQQKQHPARAGHTLGCGIGAARLSFTPGTQKLALPSSKCHLDENLQALAREVSVLGWLLGFFFWKKQQQKAAFLLPWAWLTSRFHFFSLVSHQEAPYYHKQIVYPKRRWEIRAHAWHC